MSEDTVVINMTEMAELLRCHRSTIYRLLYAKKIPGAFKIGSDWRFHVGLSLNGLRTAAHDQRTVAN